MDELLRFYLAAETSVAELGSVVRVTNGVKLDGACSAVFHLESGRKFRLIVEEVV